MHTTTTVEAVNAHPTLRITGPDELKQGQYRKYTVWDRMDTVKVQWVRSENLNLIAGEADGYVTARAPGTATVEFVTAVGNTRKTITVKP